MLKKMLLSTLCVMWLAQLHAAKQAPEACLNDIDDIPLYCADWAGQLYDQPQFTGYGALLPSKVLRLQNLLHCRLCQVLSESARKIVENAWHIHAFGINWCDGRCMFDQQGNCGELGSGIELWVAEEGKACSLHELKAAYDKVIHELKTGWKISSIIENPDIMFPEDGATWILLIKKKSAFDNHALMSVLLEVFNFNDHVSCRNIWLTGSHSYEYRDDACYLWIQKAAFDRFQELFKFQI